MPEIRYVLKLPKIPLLQPGGYEQVLQKQVGLEVSSLVEQIADEARQRTPVGVSGILRASIATRVTQGVSGQAFVQGEVFTGRQAPYAVFVEEGTKPHWAPIAPLKLWARRVLGDEQAAYRVRWAIRRRGTKARHMFRDAFAVVQPRILGALDRAVSKAVAILTREG